MRSFFPGKDYDSDALSGLAQHINKRKRTVLSKELRRKPLERPVKAPRMALDDSYHGTTPLRICQAIFLIGRMENAP